MSCDGHPDNREHLRSLWNIMYIHYTGLRQFQSMNYKEKQSPSLTWVWLDKQDIVIQKVCEILSVLGKNRNWIASLHCT